MYFVYVLQSIKDGKYYIGQTNNLTARLIRHNTGQVKATKSRIPFRLVYKERYDLRSSAIKRKIEIKRMKGGNQFKELLNEYWGVAKW